MAIGSGQGTPVVIAALSSGIATPVARTQLSLNRFARILGINPVHFNGAVGSLIWPANGSCEDIWPQYSWQTDDELVGRVDVAMTIATAEDDIKNALGCSAAATWEIDEPHTWNSAYRPGRAASLRTALGMVIAPGKRAVSVIQEGATVVYSDPDNDGWEERATITVATQITDAREIKVYHLDRDGDADWEIRPLRNISIAGGQATITLDSWLLINPDLWERYPTNGEFQAIDVVDLSNFVAGVDVFREYNDTTMAGVTFYSGGSGYACCGGVGCDICGGESYGGCFTVRDSRLGIINAFPATYGENGWAYYHPANCQPIQRLTLSYYAGLRDKRYLAGKTLDPLSDYMAEAIAWMSAARLPKSICSCNNIRERVEELQRDISRFREGSAVSPLYSRFKEMDIFGNPFGTRYGEVRAWQQLMRLHGEIGDGGAL